MAEDPIEQRVAAANLRIWRRGGERAPHKPLLLLVALGRALAGEPRLVRFRDLESLLRELLATFGPPRAPRPEYPFWHLQSDDIWHIPTAPTGPRGETPRLTAIRDLEGGLPAAVDEAVRAQPEAVRDIAEQLLTAHFPLSLHETSSNGPDSQRSCSAKRGGRAGTRRSGWRCCAPTTTPAQSVASTASSTPSRSGWTPPTCGGGRPAAQTRSTTGSLCARCTTRRSTLKPAMPGPSTSSR
jgi:hypothetical protein